jgi:hypothetical protein
VHYPNTVQSLRKAVREYHTTSVSAAERSLRTSLRAPYWKTDIGAGKARVARELLREYIRLDQLGTRPAATFDVKSQVAVGQDVIDVVVDVCLFASVGYAARLVLWDTRSCSFADARVLASPCVLALEQEFGNGTVQDAEVVHVRTSTIHQVTRGQAVRAISDVAAVLKRAQL